jgi:hypothetical protein
VTPTSFSRGPTLGLTTDAGLTPALSACQPGGAFELKSSSESTLLKVFSWQTKRIVFVRSGEPCFAKNSREIAGASRSPASVLP